LDTEASGTLEIRQYLDLLWRWLWLIALGTVLAAASAYVASRLSTPIYEASTTLLISEGQKPTGQDYSALLMSERLAKTYAQMLQGRPVLSEVALRLDLQAGDDLDRLAESIAVEPVRDTQLIRLRVSHPDPALAAAVANTIPQVLIELNERSQAARFAASLESLSGEMQRLLGEIEATQRELDVERARPDANVRVARLETLLAQYSATYAGLLQSYEEIRTTQASTIDSLTVFDPAPVPERPALPRTRQNVLLAAVVGAMLAVGTAFLVEYLDDTIKSPEDVERASGLSTFAAIARFAAPAADEEGPLMVAQPASAVAEAYRVLRTNVQFSALGLGQSGVTLLVTSAQPTEGKTTTLANLGVALAQAGKRVLLVDSDLRRPSLDRHFGLPNGMGLTTLYVAPDAEPSDVVQQTGIEGLQVITSGPLPASPAELLSFPYTPELIERCRPLGDYILLDSPPVLSVADASILAQRVDGVILVTEVGRTRTEVFKRTVAALYGVKARLLGVALNKLTPRRGGYYHYYDYYNHDRSARNRSKRERRPQSAGPVAAPAASPSGYAGLTGNPARHRLDERRLRIEWRRSKVRRALLLLAAGILLLVAAGAVLQFFGESLLSVAGASFHPGGAPVQPSP
jgi:non-specific protein-tyrosine kinase